MENTLQLRRYTESGEVFAADPDRMLMSGMLHHSEQAEPLDSYNLDHQMTQDDLDGSRVIRTDADPVPTGHNDDCDGSHCTSPDGEVRLLPTREAGNAILCHACYEHELAYRCARIADGEFYFLPAWESLQIYDAS